MLGASRSTAHVCVSTGLLRAAFPLSRSAHASCPLLWSTRSLSPSSPNRPHLRRFLALHSSLFDLFLPSRHLALAPPPSLPTRQPRKQIPEMIPHVLPPVKPFTFLCRELCLFSSSLSLRVFFLALGFSKAKRRRCFFVAHAPSHRLLRDSWAWTSGEEGGRGDD